LYIEETESMIQQLRRIKDANRFTDNMLFAHNLSLKTLMSQLEAAKIRYKEMYK